MSLQELKSDVEELGSLLASATRPKVKDILQLALRKIETEIITKEQESKDNADAPAQITAQKKETSVVRRFTKDITTYAWDQSDKFMKIYINLPDVQKLEQERVTSEFTDSSFRVRVENLADLDYSCAVAFLWEDINPSASYHKIKTNMILVMLRKVKEGSTWAYVTKKDKNNKQKKEKKPDPELNKDDPSAGLMNLMKKMYDEGDDEMKRTLNKAWAESQEKKMRGETDLGL